MASLTPTPSRLVVPDLSIRQLEYLAAVADHGTFTLAAERVGVSASALSQGLAELERRVGIELFERHGRRRVIRDTALPVVDHARQVLALTADLARWRNRLDAGLSGTVRLGMVDVAAVVHFPDVLRTFRARHTDVDLALRVEPSSSLIEALRADHVDLVVCVEPAFAPDDLEVTPLLSEPLGIYAPPGTPANTPAQEWGPWVLFPSDSHTRQRVEGALGAAGAPVAIAGESHQPDVIREMVRLGLGWTVLPRSQVDPDVDADLVSGRELLRRRLVLARRRRAVHDPVVELLARRLRRRPSDESAGAGGNEAGVD